MKKALAGQPTVLAKPANRVIPVIALRASAPIEAGDGRERGLIQAEAHARCRSPPMPAPGPQPPRRRTSSHQPGGKDEIGRGQHIPPAMPVDHRGRRAARAGRRAAARPRRRRRTRSRDRCRSADIRIGEHRRQIVGRSPGKSLRDAEGGDDDAARAYAALPCVSRARTSRASAARYARPRASPAPRSARRPRWPVPRPDWKPNRAMAVATASSKKLLAPISAEGPATHHSTPKLRFSQ